MVDPCQPGRGDPQAAHEAPEEDRLGPVAVEERLAVGDDRAAVAFEGPGRLEQPAARLAPDEAVQGGAKHVLAGLEAVAHLALSEYWRPALRVSHTLSLRDQSLDVDRFTFAMEVTRDELGLRLDRVDPP